MTWNICNVVPNPDDGWDVNVNGNILSHHLTKDDAIVFGQVLAKSNIPSKLVVQQRDGTIEFEFSYIGESTEDFQYPLLFDFPMNGGSVTFRNFTEIQIWIQKNLVEWEWIFKPLQSDFEKPVSQIHSIFRHRQQEILNKISEYRNKKEILNEDLALLKKLIHYNFSNNFIIHYTSNKYDYLKSLIRDLSQITNDEMYLARYTLSYFASIDLTYQFANTYNGNHAQLLYVKAISQAILFEYNDRDSIAQLGNELKNKLNEIIVEKNVVLEKSESVFNELDFTLSKFTKENADMIAQNKTIFEEFLNSTKSQLTATVRAFEEIHSIHAAITYWNDKAKEHKTKSRNLWYVFVILIVLSSILLFLMLKYLIGDTTEFKSIPATFFASIVLVALGSVWLIRIVARVLLSHTHLQREAMEKSVMISTYIALLKENAGLENDNDNKRLILGAIFKSSDTGLIKGDGVPNILHDLITKIK